MLGCFIWDNTRTCKTAPHRYHIVHKVGLDMDLLLYETLLCPSVPSAALRSGEKKVQFTPWEGEGKGEGKGGGEGGKEKSLPWIC